MSGCLHRCRIIAAWLLLTPGWLAWAQDRPLSAGETEGRLTSIQQVLDLGNERLQSNRAPVLLKGVLTATYPDDRRLYLQEGERAIIARYRHTVDRFVPGQVLEIEGTAISHVIQPQILAEDVRVLGTARLPEPIAAEVSGMAVGHQMARYVVVRGFVRDMMWENNYLSLLIRSDNSLFRFCVPAPPGTALPRYLIDSEVEVKGACLHMIDALRKVTAFRILAASTNDLKVLTPGISSLFDRRLDTIAAVRGAPVNRIRRYKIAGTVTAHVPGHVLFLEDDTGVARAELTVLLPPIMGPTLTLEHEPQTQLEPGERVEVIGVRFAAVSPPLYLYDCEFRRIGRAPSPAPIPIRMSDAVPGKYLNRLVSLTGRLVSGPATGIPDPNVHTWILEAGGKALQVQLEGPLTSIKDYDLGQWLKATGVIEYEAGFVRGDVPNFGNFTLRVRSQGDIVPGQPLPFWTQPEQRQAIVTGGTVGAFAGLLIVIQRRKMRQVRASEERCRALIDNSFDATVVLTAEGRLKYASPAGQRLLGMENNPGKWSEFAIEKVVDQADLPRILEAHQEVLKTPGASRHVTAYRIRRTDGSVRYAEAVGTNCINIPGVEGVVVNIRDVTERTLADEAAQRSDTITRTVNYFANSLLECDTEDEVLWDLAENCISQLGFADCVIYLMDKPSNALLQKAATGPKSPAGRVIVNPIVIPLGRGIVGSVAASGQPERVDDTRLDPRYIIDDQVRLSELAVPIVAEGEVLGVIDSEHPNAGFFTVDHLATLSAIASLCANKIVRIRAVQKLKDLNESLELHVAVRTAALRQSEERFSKAFRASPAILAILRLPGGEYLDVNDAFLGAFGFERHEVIGRTFAGLEIWQDLAQCSELCGALDAGKPVRNMETFCRTKNGESRLVLQSAEFIQLGGESCALTVGQDITERKRADEELRIALEREKELNQLKSSFVSMVSHEFRTPLEVILSSNNILDRYFDRLTPEKRTAQLRAIRKNVRRMNDMLDDVLLLGRIEAGRMDCHSVPVDLKRFCHQVAIDMESAAGVSGRIALVANGLDSEATADETILQHILSNLLSNALKYSPPDAPIEFIVTRSGGDAEFTIRDRGLGIPAVDQPSLFTAFHRGGNVGQISGSGLGLVIVRRCVESHGGTLRFSSAEGVGTTFTVTLPIYSGTGFFRRSTDSTRGQF